MVLFFFSPLNSRSLHTIILKFPLVPSQFLLIIQFLVQMSLPLGAPSRTLFTVDPKASVMRREWESRNTQSSLQGCGSEKVIKSLPKFTVNLI